MNKYCILWFVYTDIILYKPTDTDYVLHLILILEWPDDSEPTDHYWVVWTDQSCKPVSWNVKLQTVISPVIYIL